MKNKIFFRSSSQLKWAGADLTLLSTLHFWRGTFVGLQSARLQFHWFQNPKYFSFVEKTLLFTLLHIEKTLLFVKIDVEITVFFEGGHDVQT